MPADKIKTNEILNNPDNFKCVCSEINCEWRGKCRECVALHRYFKSTPACLIYKED